MFTRRFCRSHAGAGENVALRNLVMVRSDVQSVRVDDEWKTDWSIRVHLGEDVELATRRVLREVVGNVRSVGRRVL